ncbi:MAG: DinB family protein [Acidobacteriota bacterium]
MQTVEQLRELFRYNDWANRRIVVALKENDCEPARHILAHLLTTEQEYFERLYGKDSTGFEFWPDLSIAECGIIAQETGERYERLIRGFDESGLDLTASYRTSEGRLYENTFREMLTHVLIHSATHRGGIIVKIRDAGFEPPKTDHIVYLRETKYV